MEHLQKLIGLLILEHDAVCEMVGMADATKEEFDRAFDRVMALHVEAREARERARKWREDQDRK